MLPPMALMSSEDARAVAAVGTRSDPVAIGAAGATLPTSAPTPTLVAVPQGALFAQFLFDYVGGTGSTNGAPAATFWYGLTSTASAAIQAWSPVSPTLDGYGVVSLPGAAAAAHGRSATPPLMVAGWAYAGVSVAEAVDAAHPGLMTVTVVWLS